MIYFLFNCYDILWDDVTKFIWQRTTCSLNSLRFLYLVLVQLWEKLSEICHFHLLIFSQGWRHPNQLCQRDHHSLAKNAYFVTHSDTMTQPLIFSDREILSMVIWRSGIFIMPYFTTFSCLLLFRPVALICPYMASIHTPQPGKVFSYKIFNKL